MAYFSFQNLRIFYREQGEGDLILVLPGNTATSACHQGELNFFADLGYHAVSLDFPGTGQSDRLPNPWPVDWFQLSAQAALALIDHLGYQKAITCGTSGGAIVAVWMAILQPGKVKAVIADSEVASSPPGLLSKGISTRKQCSSEQVQFWSYAQGQDWEDVVNADTDFLNRLDAANPAGIDYFAGRLSEVRCPVLFSVSLADEMLDKPGQQVTRMAAQVPGSWAFATQEGSHPLMWSCPVAFRAVSSAFLQTIISR